MAHGAGEPVRVTDAEFVKKAGRSPEIIYYDVTNFYCEIQQPDEDILDEEGKCD